MKCYHEQRQGWGPTEPALARTAQDVQEMGTCPLLRNFGDELAAPLEERKTLSTFDIPSPSLPPALSKRPSCGCRAAVPWLFAVGKKLNS